MGAHLSSLQDLATDAFIRELHFRYLDIEPEELIQLSYHPINSEGFFEDDSIKVFDWLSSGLVFREAYKEAEFDKIGNNFRRDLLPKISYGFFHRHCTLAERVTLEKEIYRPTPINWTEFKLLSIIPCLEPREQLITLIRETKDPRFKKSIIDVLKYLNRLRRQILFAILFNKTKFDGQLTGIYTNPLSSFQDGVVVPFLDSHLTGADWGKNFQFLDDIQNDIPQWLEKMTRDSQAHFEKFFLFVKLSICGYRDKLRLDDTRYWHHERADSTLICNLQTYASLLSLFIGILRKANDRLWVRIRDTEKMLGQLLEIVLKE